MPSLSLCRSPCSSAQSESDFKVLGQGDAARHLSDLACSCVGLMSGFEVVGHWGVGI